MPTYLLDTNAISDAIREQPQFKARLVEQLGDVVTSVVAVGEIRYGLARLPAGKRRDDLQLKAQHVLASLRCVPVPEVAAEIYARIRRAAEVDGLPLDDNDLWIAATALAYQGTLVSGDSDFARVADLRIEDWTTEISSAS